MFELQEAQVGESWRLTCQATDCAHPFSFVEMRLRSPGV